MTECKVWKKIDGKICQQEMYAETVFGGFRDQNGARDPMIQKYITLPEEVTPPATVSRWFE